MSADTEGEPPPKAVEQWDATDAEVEVWLSWEIHHPADDADEWYAAQRILLGERAPA